MKFELVQYEPDHGRKILAETERYQWIPSFTDPEMWLEGWKRSGPAFTAMVDGVPMACGGAALWWKGRGEMWLILADSFYEHKRQGIRMCMGALALIIEACKLTRVEASVVASDIRSRRFVEWLGFEEEGLMRNYLMDTDYVRYGLVK